MKKVRKIQEKKKNQNQNFSSKRLALNTLGANSHILWDSW